MASIVRLLVPGVLLAVVATAGVFTTVTTATEATDPTTMAFWRAALYFLCAEIASAVVVLVIKNLIGRPRPTDILVTADVGSFPSGHSANAALIATTLGIIFWRTWVWIVGAAYTVLMMLSRTYLGAHWISDTVGGMLVGVGLAVIIWAPFAYVLYRERHKPHPAIWVKAATPEAAIDQSEDSTP
jgi:undecaprenyl-diphosphatase